MVLQRFGLFGRFDELEICNYANLHDQKFALTIFSKRLLYLNPKSEPPVSKDLEKINNDSIDECWLTRDIDYDWGPCYIEVYKYQTYDPNFNYPQGSIAPVFRFNY